MDLCNKTDRQILEELNVWIEREREATSHVLHYLLEVEERKLHLLQASSLFDFCVRVLKYSRHEAQVRIDAMRLLKVIPELDADLDSGRLSLSVAAQAQSAFRKESERRDSPLSIDEQKSVLADLMSASTREADRKLATHFPEQPQNERTKPVSASLTRIEFNAEAEPMKKYERLQAYYHHQTGGKWEKLFELLADREIERLDAPPRRAPGIKNDSRHVPRAIRQEVWANWDSGCDYILETGERCGSKQNLECDHIVEFSEGGLSVRRNLRLVCGPHNRYRSDRLRILTSEFMERIDAVRDSAGVGLSEV